MTAESTQDAPLAAHPVVHTGPLAALVDGTLPASADIPPEALRLADQVRDLVEAVVRTDVTAEVRAHAARRIEEITHALRSAVHPQPARLARHANGRLENLTEAGSGRLNPQAPRLVFDDDNPPPPPPGAAPRSVEVRARCELTAAHGGPPGRAHGGVVATLLDHLLGYAAATGGQSGMTVSLEVRYRRATPYGVPLELTGRWTGRDGRKSFASGEIRADGQVTAQATAVFVSQAVPPA